MIDLGQLMRERSADPPPAAALRYPQIRKRITARNRRRTGLVAAAIAVVVAIAGGYAGLARSHAPDPISPPAEMFPPFMSGTRLVHSVTAPVADRMAMLSWTPSTLDFDVVYRCSGVPGRVSVLGQMTVNGRMLADIGCDGNFTLRFLHLAGRAGADMRVGEPMTLAFTLDRATASNDMSRPVPIPTEGTIAVAIYVPVPFAEYPFPSRPARLGPLSAWTRCPPEQTTVVEQGDPLRPITMQTMWRDHLLIRYQALTPGFLRIAVDGVEIAKLEWWAFDNPSGARVWDTSSPRDFESIPGWKRPSPTKPVSLTFTPEHFTGPWQVGIEHTKTGGYTECG